MHELSIASNLIEIVDKAIEGQGVSRVTSLRVVIGELSNVVPDCLAFAFEVASRGTVAENARLDFVHKPLVGRCLDCGKEFAIRDFLFRCPDCESPKIEVVSGKEFFLESIECE
jgi:hydrogenase nickel incorporation protein HypA/HybF